MTLDPGGNQPIKIRLDDGTWEISGKIDRTQIGHLKIRAVYAVSETEESKANSIFINPVNSEFIELNPPFDWLTF